MTSTPEYTAVIIYYDTLVLALALNPLEVANKLVAKEVINHEMQEYMNLESITNYKKSSKLVNKIACKIKEDKASFYQVLQCLSGIRWTQKASRELKQHLVDLKSLEAAKLGYTTNEKVDSLLIVVGMVVVISAFCFMLLSQFSQVQVKTTTLFGRESDQKKLFDTIFQGQHSVINLVGPPGIGKTAIAINTAQQLEKLDYCYVYIDVSKHNTISSLVKQLVSNTTCTSAVPRLFYLCVSILDLVPEKMLVVWGKLLPSNTLLIFDNIEGIWYKHLNLLYEYVVQPLISLQTDLKLLLVSCYYEFIFHDNDAVISLSGINEDDCIAWILNTKERVNVIEARKLCQLVGGVPKAVKLLLSYALHHMTSESVSDIISGVDISEYGEPFREYEKLLINSDGSYHFIRALYLLYDLLSSEDRTCIWLLVGLKSNEFPRSQAVKLLHNTTVDPSRCLRGLRTHSLLEIVSFESSDHVFKFHPFIKEFIRWIGNPEHNKESVRMSVRTFYANYVLYHTTNLCDILRSTNNVQLAVRIGSNQQLINNMLPLLRGNYTKLYRLFKLALKVIEKQCCSAPGNCFTIESFANVIFSFSYLTKAVHCPDFHPVSLLSDDKRKTQSPDKCLQKLQMCDALISGMLQAKDRTDYKTAEAIGYYNTLKIFAHPSPPWHLSLLDVAMIITTANHQCHLYYKTRTYLCGEECSTELGLKLLLLKNYARSKKHLTHAFNTLKDDHHCESILKIIAMIALHSTNYNCATKDCSNTVTIKQHLGTINYEVLDSTCFLGIMNDLILPFLQEVHPDKDLINRLINKHIQMVIMMNNTCQQRAIDEQRLDCNPLNRYTISHGVTALKLFVAEWTENIDEDDQREHWICSIIRDKTDTCESVLPLFSKVRAIETNENSKVIQGLKFFMNDEEFSELEERIRNISTTFFQLMSL